MKRTTGLHPVPGKKEKKKKERKRKKGKGTLVALMPLSDELNQGKESGGDGCLGYLIFRERRKEERKKRKGKDNYLGM